MTPIRSYIPPFETPAPPFDQATPLRRTLVSTDLEAFEESCSLLEALALDDEDVRLSLARGMAFPDEHGGVKCLAEILEFIDNGDYHPLWKDLLGDGAQRKRTFDFCKAALIKAVVEIAGEEKNDDVLWDESDEKQPGGALVGQMVNWIKRHKDLKDDSRDDLLVCATLTLGNLLRHGTFHISTFQRSFFLSSFCRSALSHPYKPPCQPRPRTRLIATPRDRYQSQTWCHRLAQTSRI